MAAFSSEPVAVLDMGSSKICCLVAERTRSDGLKIRGSNIQAAEGFRSGTVVDMDRARETVKKVVEAAERMADATVTKVITTLPCANPRSRRVTIDFPLRGETITEENLNGIVFDGVGQDEVNGTRIAHALPTSYMIDGLHGIREPVGMTGEHFKVEVHVLEAERAFATNLASCLAGIELAVDAMVFPALAAGLGVLEEEERELGTAVVDIGAECTTFGIFYEGSLVHAGSVPVGGEHVTRDLARGLSVCVAEAGRIKSLHGNAAVPFGASGAIPIRPIGAGKDEDPIEVSREKVNHIVGARAEETIERVRDAIAASGFGPLLYGTVVLTGGASQLQGLGEAAARIFGRRVRIGRPVGIPGLADMLETPAFAVAAGLLSYAERRPREFLAHAVPARGRGVRSMFRWVRDNF